MEEEYLKWIQQNNPQVHWDTTGEWSAGVVRRGVGVVGGTDTGGLIPENTFIMGFTHNR